MTHGETSTPTQSSGRESSPTTERTEAHRVATEKCERALELFRNGRVSREQVIIALSKNLSDPALDLPSKSIDSTLASYLTHLEDYARTSTRSAEGPAGGSAGPGTATGQPQGEDSDAAEVRQLAVEFEQSGEEASPTQPRRRSHKRPQREKASAGSSDGSSSDDEPGSAKRRHADPSLYAWSKHRGAFDALLSPDLQETFALQRNYAEDPKQAVVDVLNCPGAPEFPAAEWLNIFKGNPIDLNHVLTSRYTLAWDEKQVEQLGDFEISHRTLVPSKPVQTAGDWVIAWQQTIKAVTFAFPHRHDELVKYNEHILGLFAAITPTLHQRILDYDRAVRKRAASARHVRLTDAAAFDDLRLQFIESAGASVASEERRQAARTGRGRTKGRRARERDPSELCRRFNAGVEHGPAGDCPYRHACLNCGSVNHPKSECPKVKTRAS